MTNGPQEGVAEGEDLAAATDPPRAIETVTPGLWELARRLGCVLIPASPLALPEGVLHPAVFEHLLGSSRRSLALFQTVLRPFDGRAADHPTRAAIYQQGVFVLRSEPEGAWRVALSALRAVGLEPGDHDLRFADRRWESRALDAQGAGWQLEIDGLGVVRVCALQRFAGREVDPPTQLVTVGIERLALVVAPVDPRATEDPPSVRSWPGDATLAEVSRWSQEVASGDWLERSLENDAEAVRQALATGLPRIAYEHAVASLVRLDQLSLRGLLPIRAREERLEAIRSRVAEIADLLVEELAGDDEGVSVSEAPTIEAEVSTEAPEAPASVDDGQPAEDSASDDETSEDGDSTASGDSTSSGDSKDAADSDGSVEDSGGAEAASDAAPEGSEAEPPPRRRSSGGRRKKKGRAPKRSRKGGSGSEGASS